MSKSLKPKQRQLLELEAELQRLTTLVRARRGQLARLEKCPNKDCECRRVWREVVETNLARQVRRIRRHVRPSKTQAAGGKRHTFVGKR